MIHRLLLTIPLLCGLAAPPAVSLAGSDRVAKLDARDADEPLSLATMTCQDVFDLYADATPADDKDPEDLAEAQDDTLYLVAWVHGFLSGRDGIGKGAPRLTKSGIEQVIADVATVCKPDPSKRFLDVVGGIQ